MAQRSHVPAFGNWESEGNVPYTVFFDKARKGKGGGPIRNPNDPEEYPEMFPDNSQEAPPPPKPKDDTPAPAPKPTTTHERRQSREYANSPGHRENPGRRQSGSDYSIDRSPLHRQTKPSGRESPVVENKNFDGGYGNRTGKTKMRPLQRDDAPEGTAVPKFGSWDVNNPASADGFTHIFGKVREERMGPGTPSPQPHSSSPYNNVKNRKTDDSAKVSCFPCLRGK